MSGRSCYFSREAGQRFVGYLTAQRMKLTGERSKTVNRPDLVEKYGYDTKFAMHALRLGLQGIEYLETGRISMPVSEPDLSTLRAVRHGKVSFKNALVLIADTEHRLRQLVDACKIKANIGGIDNFLIAAHLEHWRTRG